MGGLDQTTELELQKCPHTLAPCMSIYWHMWMYYRYNDHHIFSKLPFTTQINMAAVTLANK